MASSSSGQNTNPMSPVFVFPSHLDFYSEDPTTHKRVMTIYNPYEVDVSFKVLCNNPKKYAVVEPEGKIGGQNCADIVVRHVAINPQSIKQTDKFRIHLTDENSKEVIGKKDVLATLYQGIPDPADEKQSHSLPHRNRNNEPGQHPGTGDVIPYTDTQYNTNNQRVGAQQQQQQPNIVACLAAIACIISLFLPTEGENTNSTVFKDYPWLHLTVNQKLVFAYVLGLVTMAILRTT